MHVITCRVAAFVFFYSYVFIFIKYVSEDGDYATGHIERYVPSRRVLRSSPDIPEGYIFGEIIRAILK